MRFACSREISPAVARCRVMPHTGQVPGLVPMKSSIGQAQRSPVARSVDTSLVTKKADVGTVNTAAIPHNMPMIPTDQVTNECWVMLIPPPGS